MGVEDIVAKQDAVQAYLQAIGPGFAYDVYPYRAYAKGRATLAEVVDKARAANGRYASSLPRDTRLISFKGLLDDAGFRRPVEIARQFSLFPTEAKTLLEGLVAMGRAESLRYEGNEYYVSWGQDVIDADSKGARKRRLSDSSYGLTAYVDPCLYDERNCDSSLTWFIPEFVKRRMSNVGAWVAGFVHALIEHNRPMYSRHIRPYGLPIESRRRE